MKKRILTCMLCAFLVSSLPITTYAGENVLGTLSYWNAKSEYIGRWNAGSISVYVEKLQNANTSFYFTSGMIQACSTWEPVTGLTLNTIPRTSGATYSGPIEYYGGEAEEVEDLLGYDIDTAASGFTNITGYKEEGIWRFGSSTKYGMIFTKIEGAIFEKEASHTTSEYVNTCIHELGHALGWHGHSENSSDIMYKDGSNKTSLTNNDKNHLAQVYS